MVSSVLLSASEGDILAVFCLGIKNTHIVMLAVALSLAEGSGCNNHPSFESSAKCN